MNLREWITGGAEEALDRQGGDGSMPAGRNGPYGHPERPLRNTGHWMVTWCHVHAWTGEERYRAAAERALAYCLGAEHRPGGANWWQRTIEGRDRCNGTIGAAWTIEALVCAHGKLGSAEALRQAAEVFDLHPFERRRGLWRRVEVDGRVLSLDMTFNHQLWLAAAAARLGAAGHAPARERAGMFLDGLSRTFEVHGDGLVRHRMRLGWKDRWMEPGSPLFTVYQWIDPAGRRRPDTAANRKHTLDPVKRDTGYHAFNLHAFAVLRRQDPGHAFWGTESWRAALAFGRSEAHRRGVEDNVYAYPYNPAGFEMGWALEVCAAGTEEERRWWVRRQVEVMTGGGEWGYGARADDPETAAARIYEAVELSDLPLD